MPRTPRKSAFLSDETLRNRSSDDIFALSFEPPGYKNSLGFFLPLPDLRGVAAEKVAYMDLEPLSPLPEATQPWKEVIALANGETQQHLRRASTMSSGLFDLSGYEGSGEVHEVKKVYEKELSKQKAEREKLEQEAAAMAARVAELTRENEELGKLRAPSVRSTADKLAAGKKMMMRRRERLESGSESMSEARAARDAKSQSRRDLLRRVNALKK